MSLMKRAPIRAHKPCTVDDVLSSKVGPASMFPNRIARISQTERTALEHGYVIMGMSLVAGYDWVVRELATGIVYHATKDEVLS